MDFIVTSRQWKNSVREIYTGSKYELDTDHNPLIGRINTKFSATKHKLFSAPAKPLYLLSPSEEQIEIALQEFRQPRDPFQTRTYETWIQRWIEAAQKFFPSKSKEIFKSWISSETKQLIHQRTLAAAQRDKTTWAKLDKAVKKTLDTIKELIS